MAKLLRDLPVGSLVKDEGSKYYGKSIVWKVLEHDHPGYPEKSTTLLSEQIICLKAFDARERGNPISARYYGNNRYKVSNIRLWLNSNKSDWYSPQHGADWGPISDMVSANAYYYEKGFMTNLTPELRSAILPTSLKVTKNSVDGEGLESFTDKIFIPSCTEVGLSNNTSYDEGTKFDYFKSNSDRVATTTKECVENSDFTSSGLKPDYAWYWWTRTPDSSSSHPENVRYVDGDGSRNHDSAYVGNKGVRPTLNLESGILVSDSPDASGVYSIMWNQPPEKPEKITLPDMIISGQENEIMWSKSTDPEGDKVSYKLERKVNNGSWTQVYQGESTSYNDTVLRTHNTVQYRVRAYDIHGNESDWTLSQAVEVIHNRLPVISGEDSNLGTKEGEFTIKYTVNDEDEGDKVIVREKVDGKIINEFSATLGKENTIRFEKESWLTLLNGEHIVEIAATDSKKATSVRKYSFVKDVKETTLTLKEPLLSEELITRTIVNISGSMSINPNLKIEICNNGFDEKPTWIDVTQSVILGNKIFFENEVKTADKWGYNFKLTLKKDKGGEEVYLKSISGNFE